MIFNRNDKKRIEISGNVRYKVVEYVTLDVSKQPDGHFVVQTAERDLMEHNPVLAVMAELTNTYRTKFSTIQGFVKDGKLNGEYRRTGDVDEHLLFINGAEAMNLKLVPLDDKLKFQLALQYDLGFL